MKTAESIWRHKNAQRDAAHALVVAQRLQTNREIREEAAKARQVHKAALAQEADQRLHAAVQVRLALRAAKGLPVAQVRKPERRPRIVLGAPAAQKIQAVQAVHVCPVIQRRHTAQIRYVSMQNIDETMLDIRRKLMNGDALPENKHIKNIDGFYRKLIKTEDLLKEQPESKEHVQFGRYFSVIKLFALKTEEKISNIIRCQQANNKLYRPFGKVYIPFHADNCKGNAAKAVLTVLYQFETAFDA